MCVVGRGCSRKRCSLSATCCTRWQEREDAMKRKFRNDCLENSIISRRMSEQQNDSNEQGNLNSFINFAKYRNNIIVRCRFSREPNTSKSGSVYKWIGAHNRNIRLFFYSDFLFVEVRISFCGRVHIQAFVLHFCPSLHPHHSSGNVLGGVFWQPAGL